MKKLLTVTVLLVLILSTATLFASGGGEKDPLKATYSWAAGGVGGGWYTTAGGMAAIVNDAQPGLTIKIIPGGGTANPVKVNAGEDEFGWGVAYVDKAAYNGTAPLYDQAYTDIRGLVGGFSVDFYHFVAAANTGVTTIEQFVQKVKNGERLNVGAPMVGTSERALTEFVLAYYNISYEMIEKNGGRVIYGVYSDLTNSYKDRHVDYIVSACLSLPGAAVTEMSVSRPSILMSASDELIKFCATTYGTVALETGYCVVPGGTYTGMPNDIQTLCHSTEIICNKDLPEIVAYTFTKILMERIADVHALMPSFALYLKRETAPNTVVPLHPGAERYYREAGLLK